MLRKRGFHRVTLFDKSARVGGKCHTIEHDGRTYELGAGIHTRAYRTVSEIMRDVGAKSTPVWRSMHVDFDTAKLTWAWAYILPRNPLAFGVGAARLAAEMVRHRRILEPGFAGIDRELATPFARWATDKKVEAVANALASAHTGFGYGYYEEIAAAYVLKYVSVIRVAREFLDGGWGGLWRRVAARQDVRLHTAIRSIARSDTVTVTTADDTFEFDYLILASPLDESLSFLDATEEETDLFSRIRYYDYHVFAGFAEGLPETRYAFIPRQRPGRTMFWYRRWLDTNLCAFYSLGRSSVGMREPMEH